MSQHEHYSAECLCGTKLTSETKELTCSSCGQLITLEWPCSTTHGDRQ
jgi:hypothetical protein